MLTEKEIQEIIEYVSGSCQMGGLHNAAENILERELSHEEEDQLDRAVDDADLFECEQCGWWTHPGEGLGPICDECLDENNEDQD